MAFDIKGTWKTTELQNPKPSSRKLGEEMWLDLVEEKLKNIKRRPATVPNLPLEITLETPEERGCSLGSVYKLI